MENVESIEMSKILTARQGLPRSNGSAFASLWIMIPVVSTIHLSFGGFGVPVKDAYKFM